VLSQQRGTANISCLIMRRQRRRSQRMPTDSH